MFTRHTFVLLAAVAAALASPSAAPAADPFADVVEKANRKLVKVFGAGGFQRLNNYGTGIVITQDGHILTVASQLLDTSDLVVHLYDGQRLKAQVVVTEPELDVALIKIKVDGKKIDEPTGLDLRLLRLRRGREARPGAARRLGARPSATRSRSPCATSC